MEHNIKLLPKDPMYAYAYIAYQPFENLYPENKALYYGTIFKDLYMPFEDYKDNPAMNPF